MCHKENMPFQFPIEIPPKQSKFDKGAIVDVVEAECNPKEAVSDSFNDFYSQNSNQNNL